MTWTQEKKYTIELEMDNITFLVEFLRKTRFVEDFNYGADADGNRGCYMLMIDEDYAENIYVSGKPLNEFEKEFQLHAEAEINNWLEFKEVEPDKKNYQE
jgi:hypothetical protein